MYGRILWNFGIRGLWRKFWYDVGIRKHYKRKLRLKGPELKARLRELNRRDT